MLRFAMLRLIAASTSPICAAVKFSAQLRRENHDDRGGVDVGEITCCLAESLYAPRRSSQQLLLGAFRELAFF